MEGIVEDFLAKCSAPHKRLRLIAFYGGSFTGIYPALLERYLAVGTNLVKRGIVHGLKASTRPDLLDAAMLNRLKEAGLVELELGAQSMDDDVLALSGRGHSSADTRRASLLVKSSGLRLGIQIMPGLPGENRQSLKATVEEVKRLVPDTARVYPTVVIAGTALEVMYREGTYTPLSLDEAVARALYAYAVLQAVECTIIRIGLPLSPGLKVTAGPLHHCFGYLVRALGFRLMAERLLAEGDVSTLRVNPRDIPELLGYQRENQLRLKFAYMGDEQVPRGCLYAGGRIENACLTFMDIIHRIL